MVLPDAPSLPVWLTKRELRTASEIEHESLLVSRLVRVLQQPQHQIVPVARLMRHARGQPVYGGYTPGDPTRTQLIAAISKR